MGFDRYGDARGFGFQSCFPQESFAGRLAVGDAKGGKFQIGHDGISVRLGHKVR